MRPVASFLVALVAAVSVPATGAQAVVVTPEIERAARFVAWYTFARLPDCGHPEIVIRDQVRAHTDDGWARLRTRREGCRVLMGREWVRLMTPVDFCAAVTHASGHLIGYDHGDGRTVPIMARLYPLDFLPCAFVMERVS